MLTVSELAARAQITADTVRYYGRLGLLPEIGRTDAGHRFYDESSLERVRFIKGAQWFELTLDDIRELLAAVDGDGSPCQHTREVVVRRIEAIDAQRAHLEEMRGLLCRLIGADPAVTSKGPRVERSEGMTDTLVAASDTPAVAGCGCCRPPEPPSVEEERQELEARMAAVERRLANLREVAR